MKNNIKEEIKVGDKVRILAIHPNDAYYDVQDQLIGRECVINFIREVNSAKGYFCVGLNPDSKELQYFEEADNAFAYAYNFFGIKVEKVS